MRKVGLIGCGAIGTVIARAVERRIVECDEIILYDYKKEKSEKLMNSLTVPVTIVNNVKEMLVLKPQVVVEAASQQAVIEYADQILNEKVDLIVMSTGALLNLDTRSRYLHVPSGAIGGLDAISSASLAGIDKATLISRKNPRAFKKSNKKPEIVFEGSAEEATKRFPRGINVAATLALTVKPAKVKVLIVSDPQIERNTHVIQVKWKSGSMSLSFSNDPHPENPRTSALAAWAAISLLKKLLENRA
ncbi:aspartate dehydrogenase [Candidatus Bathyarchaeota archaeon]|nr:aspartate dehydrogenase [Candidatus Bathyarchaeota archaeon]